MLQPSAAPNTNDLTTAAVLLVETDLLFTARIVAALERAGYIAAIVAGQDAAIQHLDTYPTSLVIINLSAARLGGLALVRQIKERSPHTRVLAYLSHVRIPDVRQEAADAGVDKLCANSAVSLRLADLVRDTLNGRGPREEE
jgi:DNA-binding NarL/FixJ family response regulator